MFSKTAFFILFCILPLALRSAEPTLNVQESSDTRKAMQMSMDIGFGLMMRCMEATSQEMKSQGKSDDEIGTLLMDPAQKAKMKETCPCRFKKESLEALKELDGIIKKHPDWRGKTIMVKQKNGTGKEKISIKGLEEIKNKVSKCS